MRDQRDESEGEMRLMYDEGSRSRAHDESKGWSREVMEADSRWTNEAWSKLIKGSEEGFMNTRFLGFPFMIFRFLGV